MLKNVTQLEHKIGERTFHLLCDSMSPLHEVKAALCEFLKYIGNIEDNIAAQRAQEASKEEAEKKAEEAENEKPSE